LNEKNVFFNFVASSEIGHEEEAKASSGEVKEKSVGNEQQWKCK
jgi:hypothetical protein